MGSTINFFCRPPGRPLCVICKVCRLGGFLIGGYKMRALISVSDKTGIVDFAKELVKLGIEIINEKEFIERVDNNE